MTISPTQLCEIETFKEIMKMAPSVNQIAQTPISDPSVMMEPCVP